MIGGSSEEREKAMKNLTDKAASNAKGFASVTCQKGMVEYDNDINITIVFCPCHTKFNIEIN